MTPRPSLGSQTILADDRSGRLARDVVIVALALCVGGCSVMVDDTIDRRRESRDARVDAASGDAGDAGDADTLAACVESDACSDGLACNGVELCDPASPSSDADGCVAATAPTCPVDQPCVEEVGGCACGGVAACRIGARCNATLDACFGDYPAWPVPTNVRSGLPVSRSYRTEGGAVVDLVTGLVWQQNDGGRANGWSSALSYCANLSLNGASDWRLPTVAEWGTLLGPTSAGGTTHGISYYFSSTESRPTWTATERFGQTGLVWTVLGSGGGSTFDAAASKDAGYTWLVRCVRGSGAVTPTEPRFATTADVVTDTRTGLTWTRSASNVALASYASNCANLVLGGFDDWRLPELSEVVSLFDPSLGFITTTPFANLAQPASSYLWIETGGAVTPPDAKATMSTFSVSAAASGDTAMLLCVR